MNKLGLVTSSFPLLSLTEDVVGNNESFVTPLSSKNLASAKNESASVNGFASLFIFLSPPQ